MIQYQYNYFSGCFFFKREEKEKNKLKKNPIFVKLLVIKTFFSQRVGSLTQRSYVISLPNKPCYSSPCNHGPGTIYKLVQGTCYHCKYTSQSIVIEQPQHYDNGK